jgi:TPR repeat protein
MKLHRMLLTQELGKRLQNLQGQEAVKGDANSQGLLGQLYHFGQGGLPKSSELAVIWYSVSMANGNTAD